MKSKLTKTQLIVARAIADGAKSHEEITKKTGLTMAASYTHTGKMKSMGFLTGEGGNFQLKKSLDLSSDEVSSEPSGTENELFETSAVSDNPRMRRVLELSSQLHDELMELAKEVPSRQQKKLIEQLKKYS